MYVKHIRKNSRFMYVAARGICQSSLLVGLLNYLLMVFGCFFSRLLKVIFLIGKCSKLLDKRRYVLKLTESLF